jgi:hypothetical protein
MKILLITLFCFPVLCFSQPVGFNYQNFNSIYALWNTANANAFIVYSGLNTIVNMNGTGGGAATSISTISFSSGKIYCEEVVQSGSTANNIGFVTSGYTAAGLLGQDNLGWSYQTNGRSRHNGSQSGIMTAYTVGDVIGLAIDDDNGKAWFSVNGVYVGSGNPATGANPTFTFTAGTTFWIAAGCGSSGTSNLKLVSKPQGLTNPPPPGFQPGLKY